MQKDFFFKSSIITLQSYAVAQTSWWAYCPHLLEGSKTCCLLVWLFSYLQNYKVAITTH